MIGIRVVIRVLSIVIVVRVEMTPVFHAVIKGKQ